MTSFENEQMAGPSIDGNSDKRTDRQEASLPAAKEQARPSGATTTTTATATMTRRDHTEDDDPNSSSSRSCALALQKRWSSLMDLVRDGLSRCVLMLSHHAASHPVSYVVGTLVLSFGLLGIGFATNFDMTAKSDVSFTPFHSVINEQKEWILEESLFPPKPHSIRVLIHNQGASVTSREGVDKAFEVIQAVQGTGNYLELCEERLENNDVGFGGMCHIRGVPLFWNNTLAEYQASVQSDVDVLLAISATNYPDTSKVEPLELMGHIEYYRDTIVSAESFLMEILVPEAPSNSRGLTEAILGTLLDLRQEWSSPKGDDAGSEETTFRLEAYFTDHSLEAETLRAVFKDLPLIPIVFVIMAIFTCLVFSVSHRPDGSGRCKQRLWLGFGAVSAVCLSMAASYGMLFIIGTYAVGMLVGMECAHVYSYSFIFLISIISSFHLSSPRPLTHWLTH